MQNFYRQICRIYTKSLWSKRRALDVSCSNYDNGGYMTIYAFPSGHNPQRGRQEDGMTLRDYFAAKAMQSLLWNPDAQLDSKEDIVAAAYEYADEMMKARDA